MLAQPLAVWLPYMIFRNLGNCLWGLAKLAETSELRKLCRLVGGGGGACNINYVALGK